MSSKLDLNEGGHAEGIVASRSSRLTEHYPAAYTDFFGLPSGAPCVYKSGPAWPERENPEAQRFIREARPVYGHPITPSWLEIGTKIYKFLDSYGILWTSIDPIAFANAGEKDPSDILRQAGFPDIEVAFRESEVTRSVSGMRLLPFDPADPTHQLRKPFTPTLGISIAPLKNPKYQGTGALYFRFGKDDERVLLLTAAHVARPPPEHSNTRLLYKNRSRAREEIIVLGDERYENATNTMMATINTLTESVELWNNVIAGLGEFVEGEDAAVTEWREENQREVEGAMQRIDHLNRLRREVTTHMNTPDKRVIGFVLHAEPIVVADGPNGFTRDWALIQLYREKIDWDTFPGNKIYIGGNFLPSEFGKLMFPHVEDQAGYKYPRDGLLQAFGVVKNDEIEQPKHLDANGDKTLLVVKNGLASGTTIGRANGLRSFIRFYEAYNIQRTSIEVAIVSYDAQHSPFSAPGDSGSIILDRAGRIVALLTSGGGVTDRTDVTYGTPYWWIEEQVKEAHPGCHLYPVVA